MHVLVVGGTAFVGRAISLAALEAGHEVTVLNRGQTKSDLPASVERLVGDRQGDLSALQGRSYDATLDVIAYRAGDVDRLADALGDRGGHYLQISSVSAYSDAMDLGASEEQASLWPEGEVDDDAEITGATYGPLKAAAERAAHRRFGERVTCVRPTYVVGAHDRTMRFPYWVARCLRGGDVVVPSPPNSALQYVDARDLATLCVGLVERGVAGAFTAAGPWPHASFVATIERVATHVGPEGTTVVGVDPAVIESQGLIAKFPLWSGAEPEPAMTMDPSKALDAGLSLRSVEESAEDVIAWFADREWPAQWLTAEEEARLLA